MADSKFLGWCKQHGIQSSKVRPGYVAEGWRGIIATDIIEPDTVIMRVPELLLMSVLSARRDPRLAAALQHHQLNSHQILAIHLLFEAAKGSSSFWHPYIQQLPLHFTTLMAWPAAAVAALQLPRAQEEAAEAVTKARSEWTSARAALQELGVPKKLMSWRAWCWSSSCVLSRTMYHPGDPDTGCLTPLADLHNYQPPPPPHEGQLGYSAQQLWQQHQPGTPTRTKQQHQQHQQQHQHQQHQHQHQQPPDLLWPSVVVVAGQSVHGSGHDDHLKRRDLWCQGEQKTSSYTLPSSQQQQESQEEPPLLQQQQQQHGQQQHQQLEQQQPITTTTSDCIASECTAAGGCAGVTEDNSSSTLCGDGYFDSSDKLYKIVARRRYEPGDQVFLCYGRHTNLDLLIMYGFMLDDNPHDQAMLQHDNLQHNMQQLLKQRQRQQQGEGRQWKRQQQQQQQQGVVCHLDISAADCWVSVKGGPSWELLRALRLAAATPVEARRDGRLAHEGIPISVTSELLVLQCLMMSCQQALDLVATTAEQDQATLRGMEATAAAAACRCTSEAAPIADNDSAEKCQQVSQQQQQHEAECVQLAVRWRLCYKQSLINCINRCRQACTLLQDADGSL